MDHTGRSAFQAGATMSLMEGKSPKLSDPNSVRYFIYVDDIVRAFITATEKPHGVYNIGTGVQSSLREVVKPMFGTWLYNRTYLGG